ncbi:LysR family transcriptional regulator [Kribbella sp. VKM Ac-2566]|uniref:LysR family transcriptional regulator n=1 Tax=Kribbella sp. VKM Ac-2566 TaxID=2512218 RepID=UPI001064451D|nr:LysR family transcriptional regulator [Kribbella sp. VKM Ac-2566]TDW86352.1 DNA-binding transcriptional LysR family regulator [Kribbella sp. VKM Ac-2566]
MDLDSGTLRAFVTVADEGHFGRAAERLVISQQAISKRINRLESQLGVSLFDRSLRNVRITETGRRLLPLARQAVDTADALAVEAARNAGPLRIDVLDDHLSSMLIARGVAQRGDVVVEARTRTDHHDALEALRTTDVDIALGRAGAVTGPWPADLRRRVVLLEPIRLLVGARHPLAGRDAVPMADLRDARLWFPMTGAPREWIDLVDELCADFGLTVDRTGSTLGLEYFLGRLADDPGLGTLFGGAMAAPGPGLAVVPIVDPVPVFAWWAMWRRRVPDSRVQAVQDAASRLYGVPLEAAGDTWMPAADRARL